jgi:hypothetical protein
MRNFLAMVVYCVVTDFCKLFTLINYIPQEQIERDRDDDFNNVD